MVQVIPFRRTGIDILAHYASRKRFPETTQFLDCCINARITEKVELRLDWPEPNSGIVQKLRHKAHGLPILLVGLPRSPMGRTDGFGAEILPDCRKIQQLIDLLNQKYYIVQIGAGVPTFEFQRIDCDLANKTTVSELLDVFSICDGVLGYCSFVLAAAESLNKKTLMVWSRAGLNSKDEYIRQITPQKIIEHPEMTQYIIDDCTEQELNNAASAFLQ